MVKLYVPTSSDPKIFTHKTPLSEPWNWPSCYTQSESRKYPSWFHILPETLPKHVGLEATVLNNLSKNTSVLLSGSTGSGKTHTAILVALLWNVSKAKISVSFLDCQALQTRSTSLSHLLQQLDLLFQSRDTLIILDNLSALVPAIESSQKQQQSFQSHVSPILIQQTKVLTDCLRHYITGRGRVLATTTDSIHSSLLGYGRFQVTLSLPSTWDAESRFDLLSQMMPGHVLDQARVARSTQGYRPADLKRLASNLIHEHGDHSPTDKVWIKAIQHVALHRNNNNKCAFTASVSWNQLGGLSKVKRSLEELVEQPLLYNKVFELAPISLPRGILLHGPSGCGKSLIARALADKLNLSLIVCKGPEVLDKYIGASEFKVRQLWQDANAAAPSILFLDDLDALAPRRGADNTGVTDRVVNQLLTLLDGVESASSNDAQVYIIAATSRPDAVDPALLRPGRLDTHLFVGPPATEDERNDVWQTLCMEQPLDSEAKRLIQSRQFFTTELQNHVRSFTPADYKAALDTAYIRAVHNHIENKAPLEVSIPFLRDALLSTQPSSLLDSQDSLNKMTQQRVTLM